MGKKGVGILGSTGSIGTQALEVIHNHPGSFSVELLTAGDNYQLLIRQALDHQPNMVVIANENHYPEVASVLQPKGIKVYAGQKALQEVVESESLDIVLTALVGFSGLQPTLNAIRYGKHIAIANKETLVVAGDLVTRLAADKGVALLPVDSEHSAIFQCLAGEFHNPVEKIILTASGGPFLGWTREQLEKVSSAQALQHPNWKMGNKITIDSASMMNKGLEVIEAHWLFGVSAEQIEVVIHPQSVIHSMVQFTDGSIKAQMGHPDMRLPILYALSYPRRLISDFPRFSFTSCTSLSFESPDTEMFRNLTIAYKALKRKGNTACVMNAANEVVVHAFLQEKIGFLQMPDIIEQTINEIPFIENPELDDYLRSDEWAREITNKLINK